jgi:hypothetical protein
MEGRAASSDRCPALPGVMIAHPVVPDNRRILPGDVMPSIGACAPHGTRIGACPQRRSRRPWRRSANPTACTRLGCALARLPAGRWGVRPRSVRQPGQSLLAQAPAPPRRVPHYRRDPERGTRRRRLRTGRRFTLRTARPMRILAIARFWPMTPSRSAPVCAMPAWCSRTRTWSGRCPSSSATSRTGSRTRETGPAHERTAIGGG